MFNGAVSFNQDIGAWDILGRYNHTNNFVSKLLELLVASS
jgi:hypothetical protein